MTALRPLRLVALLAVLGAVTAGEARAQSNVGSLIVDTYIENKIDLFDQIVPGVVEFSFNSSAFDAAAVLDSSLALDTAAFPIGSSSGGFTYTIDAASGAPLRSSPSFGPAFAERPLTAGRGNLTVGFTYLHRSADKLEGQNMDNGEIKFYEPLNYTNGAGVADLIVSTLNISVANDIFTMFATYGVTNKLDVSVAVPVQHVTAEVQMASELMRFGPTSGSGIERVTTTRSGSANGIGDIALRAKYNFFNGPRAAIAGGLDVRLPTGDAEELLGTGLTRTKLYVAFGSSGGGSAADAKVFPHANFGYTFGTDPENAEFFWYGSEVSYAAGVEYVAHPRLTVIGDIFGRSLSGEGRLQETAVPYELVRTTTTPAQSVTVSELQYQPDLRLNSTLASIGAKFNLKSTFIVSAHVVFQFTDAGIKSSPTPVLGFDYTF